MRLETDSLGSREVPDEAYFGIHTLRSSENFSAAGERLPLELIYAMARLKQACALANAELELLAGTKAEAVVAACERVLRGELDEQFPIDVFQSGSGTSSNMNLNEVLANVACEILGGVRGDRSLVHPNDDVNKGQSTNNVFPSGIRVACVELCDALMGALRKLAEALRVKAQAFESVVKAARTHLQDAVPIALGQEFGAYASALEKDMKRLTAAQDALRDLGIGGNAVGTGINAPPAFRTLVVEKLNAITGGQYRQANDGVEATQFLTDLAQMSSALRLLSLDLLKIGNDLRLMASGPHTGLGEIRLPPVEPGSSIMPGKINPSICEAANMACIQVIGYDAAVAAACGAGQLELNTHMPLIGTDLVRSFGILKRCCAMLAEKCVGGIEARAEVCRRHFESSAGLATVLNPVLGYDIVAELVKESLRDNKPLRKLVAEKKLMGEQEFEKLIRGATRPNLPSRRGDDA